GTIGVVWGDDGPAVVVEERRARPVRAVAQREARAASALALDREVEQGGTVERHARDHLRLIDVLALAGAIAVGQAGERTNGPVHAAGVVHVRPAPAGGRL